MTTLRQRDANRRNAQQAAGPKTLQGKRRSAVNATRHGLTVPLLTTWWGTKLPQLQALLCADGLNTLQAHSLAVCILEYERNLQHQRNSYLLGMGLPGSGIDTNAAGQAQRNMAQAIEAHMPARGSPIPGVSRSAAKSAARFLLKVGLRKQTDAEKALRNAHRHLRRAVNQLIRQCRALAA